MKRKIILIISIILALILVFIIINITFKSNEKTKEEKSILKAKESKTFKITDNKRYLSANELECYVYEIKK